MPQRRACRPIPDKVEGEKPRPFEMKGIPHIAN
jgi:hypothetical protein